MKGETSMGETYDETQEIIEPGDGLRNDPRNHPKETCNSNPRSDANKTVSMHVARTAEDSNVYIFAINVPDDNTSNVDLYQNRVSQQDVD